MIKSRSDHDATSHNRSTKTKKISRNSGEHFSAVSPQKERKGFTIPSFILPVFLSYAPLHIRFVFFCKSFCLSLQLLRRLTRLGRPLLSTWRTGPGGPRAGPPLSGLQASRVPTSSGPSDVRCPECAATRRPLLLEIVDFFLLSVDPLTHFTGSVLLLILLFSFLPLPIPFYFGTREETGSSSLVVGADL